MKTLSRKQGVQDYDDTHAGYPWQSNDDQERTQTLKISTDSNTKHYFTEELSFWARYQISLPCFKLETKRDKKKVLDARKKQLNPPRHGRFCFCFLFFA